MWKDIGMILSVGVAVFGFFIMAGAMGLSDNNVCSGPEIGIRMIIGLGIFGVGYLSCRAILKQCMARRVRCH